MAIETQSGAQRENAFQNTLGLRLHATAKLASYEREAAIMSTISS